jgi:chitodextrinase
MYLDGAPALHDVGDGRSAVGEVPLGDEACVAVDHGTGPSDLPAANAPWPADPAWDDAVVYVQGDRVSYDGALFEAAWRSQGRKPGASAHCPWQEIATTGGGTALWTRSRIFEPGDVAVHGGVLYAAQWWTRGQVPGDPHGPWLALR